MAAVGANWRMCDSVQRICGNSRNRSSWKRICFAGGGGEPCIQPKATGSDASASGYSTPSISNIPRFMTRPAGCRCSQDCPLEGRFARLWRAPAKGGTMRHELPPHLPRRQFCRRCEARWLAVLPGCAEAQGCGIFRAGQPCRSRLLRLAGAGGAEVRRGGTGCATPDRQCSGRSIPRELLHRDPRAAEREIESQGRVRTEIQDGYAALKAFLPPDERRGLVLIDPPYESLDELKMMLQAFSEAYRRWPSGVYLMWYPIRSATQRSMVHARFEALQIPKMLLADIAIHPDDAGLGLAGSGLMIVNPPYGADQYLRDAYGAIHQAIAAPGAGYVEVERLTPERMAQ